MEVQRGVTRPAAAARQPGAEMNETYGMSTSEGISQDNLVLNFYPNLSRVKQVWRLYPNLSRDMQDQKSHPDLSWVIPIYETFLWLK